MEYRQLCDEYREIAEELIDTVPELRYIKESAVRIIYLQSDSTKKHGKNFVNGECEKVPAKYQWAIEADFTITLYSPNILTFTPEQIKILLIHELLHVGIDKDTAGEEVYSINDHDIQDFKSIIDRYGADWHYNNHVKVN